MVTLKKRVSEDSPGTDVHRGWAVPDSCRRGSADPDATRPVPPIPASGWNQSKLLNSFPYALGICFDFVIKHFIVIWRVWGLSYSLLSLLI